MTMEMPVIQRAPLVPRLSHMPPGNGNHLPYPHGGAMSPRMLAGLKLASMFPQQPNRPQSRMGSAMTAGVGPGMAGPGMPPTARGLAPQTAAAAAAAAFLCPAPSTSCPAPMPSSRIPLSPSTAHHAAAGPAPPNVPAMPSPPQLSPPPLPASIPTSPAHLPPPHLPGMVARPQPITPHPQHPQPLHPHHPSVGEHHHRFLAPVPLISFMFGQNDLDMLLYGYAKSRERLAGHALSGLRFSELSHGMDKILGGQVKTYSPAKPIQVVTVDPASLDIPEELELQQTTFAGTIHYGIFSKKGSIPKGTRFGPFRGKQVNTSEIKTNDDNTHMWEIFEEGKLSHFVDGRGCSGNWMAYVNCARYAQEQNLIAIQVEGEIFYESCKDILQGTELLVWYGDSYLQFMGIPVALKDMGQPVQEESEGGDGFRCDRCGKVFAYKYYRDKHLKYTRCVDHGDRKFPCHLCTRSFEKRDRLRIHILHVHEKHRPHKCMVCAKSFSQSSSLNKHMRVHSGERPYKCVYCSKAFTASSILRTHIRQHSGEKPFKCKHCGKSFASHAAHDSHVRRTHTRERAVTCHVCGKHLASTSDLNAHMASHNGVRHTGSVSPASSSTDSYGMPTSYEEPLDVVGIDNDTSRLI